MSNEIPTPTLDRMQAPHEVGMFHRKGEPCRLVDHSQFAGEFLDWLEGQGIHLGKWTEMNPDEAEYEGELRLLPHFEERTRMLARYFEIDLDDVEREKRALLAAIRETNE